MSTENTQIEDVQPIIKAAESSRTSGFRDFLADVVVVVIVSTLAALLVYRFAPTWLQAAGETKPLPLVTVNFDLLVSEQISALGERVRLGELEPEDMPKQSKRFSQALLDALREYTDKGYVVLRTDSVLSAPQDVEDITNTLRDRLINEGAMQKSKPKAE